MQTTKEKKKPYRVKKPPEPSPNQWNYYPIVKPSHSGLFLCFFQDDYHFGSYNAQTDEMYLKDKRLLYSAPECFWHYLPEKPVLDDTQELEEKGVTVSGKKVRSKNKFI